MKLVNEEDDTGALVCGFLDLVKDRFDTLFVLATVGSTCHERAHVKRVETTNERSGNIAVDNSLRKAFGNCSLPNTRFTDQDRVILRPIEQQSAS